MSSNQDTNSSDNSCDNTTNNTTTKENWQSDLRFSHVDIIVDDLRLFLNTWCPKLGFVPSKIQTWGSPNNDNEDATWSEFALVFDRYSGQLMFMVIEGKKGAHVEVLQKYGSGSIYRLCFKTDHLEACFDHLQSTGTKVTNLEGTVPFRTYQEVVNSGNLILWLERHGELSMDILTAPIIDAGCEKLRQEVGLMTRTNKTLTTTKKDSTTKQQSKWEWGPAVTTIAALGSAFLLGFICGRR